MKKLSKRGPKVKKIKKESRFSAKNEIFYLLSCLMVGSVSYRVFNYKYICYLYL